MAHILQHGILTMKNIYLLAIFLMFLSCSPRQGNNSDTNDFKVNTSAWVYKIGLKYNKSLKFFIAPDNESEFNASMEKLVHFLDKPEVASIPFPCVSFSYNKKAYVFYESRAFLGFAEFNYAPNLSDDENLKVLLENKSILLKLSNLEKFLATELRIKKLTILFQSDFDSKSN